MVAGHLREQNGLYQIILSYKDGDGKRKTKSISTGLPVKGNKRKAEAMLMDARQTFVPPCFLRSRRWKKQNQMSFSLRTLSLSGWK